MYFWINAYRFTLKEPPLKARNKRIRETDRQRNKRKDKTQNQEKTERKRKKGRERERRKIEQEYSCILAGACRR